MLEHQKKIHGNLSTRKSWTRPVPFTITYCKFCKYCRDDKGVVGSGASEMQKLTSCKKVVKTAVSSSGSTNKDDKTLVTTSKIVTCQLARSPALPDYTCKGFMCRQCAK